MGGVRSWEYSNFDAHLNDALNLSESMTLKNSICGINFGGGKAVINLKGIKKTADLYKSYAEGVEKLKGKWSEIITSVTNLRTSVGMVLEHCIPLEFVGKKAQVGMVDQPHFNLDLLKKNKEMIEDVAANHVKQKIKIKFFTVQKDDQLAEELSKNVDPQNQDASTKSNPVVDRVIELFDGEILR